MRVRFSADWSAYVREREWHASQSIQPLDDGGLELSMEVGGQQELANWVLSFGAGAEVLEPASLRDEIRRSFEEALAHYL